MRRSPDDLSPDVRALLESGRPVVPVSLATRIRAEARARASLSAPVPSWDDPIRHRTFAHRNWWAVAASIALVAAVAGGAAAYELHVRAVSSRPLSAPPAPVPERLPRPSEVIVLPVEAPSVEVPAPAPQPVARVVLVRQELQLVQRARAAMARRDFAAALPPLAEHMRRFRDGRLAEEREALRVKALSGLGRTREARRALSAFGTRFPRSPLLPALSHLVDSAP
jgi:hypothetical protein